MPEAPCGLGEALRDAFAGFRVLELQASGSQERQREKRKRAHAVYVSGVRACHAGVRGTLSRSWELRWRERRPVAGFAFALSVAGP